MPLSFHLVLPPAAFALLLLWVMLAMWCERRVRIGQSMVMEATAFIAFLLWGLGLVGLVGLFGVSLVALVAKVIVPGL